MGVNTGVADKIATASDLLEKLQPIDEALRKCRYQQDALIEVLHTAQKTYGYLDEVILDYLSLQLRLPPSLVYGVATFYNFFTLEPQAEQTCVVCLGTACYIKNAAAILAQIEKTFSLETGKTTSGGKLRLLTTRCFGSCSLAPMLTIEDEVMTKLTPEAAIEAIRTKLLLSGDGKAREEA